MADDSQVAQDEDLSDAIISDLQTALETIHGIAVHGTTTPLASLETIAQTAQQALERRGLH